ncbi:MAG: DegQ family serine endoprotease [Betaproteobacteria bacterium]|nr:DegQ family serine endoprotease [Betaproteobacteria bacterium]
MSARRSTPPDVSYGEGCVTHPAPGAPWRRMKAALGALGFSVVAAGAALGGAPLAQAQALSGLPDFTELVERVGPSVVNIRTTERASRSGRAEMDPQMEEFFRRFGIPMPGTPNPGRRNAPRGGEDEPPQQRGVGSGFVLTADGFIMTNAHVVDGADEVLVTLPDKREFKARIVGADANTDVAVVKIDATGLPVVKIGDTNRLKVGEWVMAIGSPFGLDNSVTAGIVSAKQRDTGDFLPFIQTDVAINPGNSGGPLINLRGEVVGINSQIYSRSGGFMGISFAIPIDEAMRVADQLRANGRVIRGRIGVSIGQVSKEVAESLGLGKPSGALVQGVESGSPADKAGVEPGDIILKVDGKVVEKSGDLRRLIGATKPGSRATLQVLRRGSTRDISVTVGEFEAERPRRAAAGTEPREGAASKLPFGLTVTDTTEAQRKELRVRGGVRVEAVDGPAARAGLREGDVIVAFDNQEVTDAKQFAALVKKADGNRPVPLVVNRGGSTNLLVLRPR